MSSERFTNHHHSVSDGVLSYSGSPTDNVHEPRWTSPAQKFNIGELPASNMRGNAKSILFLFLDASFAG